jgi:4a-hydroxytetrahydrobiopterin dehydratase
MAQMTWTDAGDALVGEGSFADFVSALAWINRVGAVAEQRDHHPDILLHGYRHVRLTLSTHTAGGVTEADHGLATAIDALG